MNLNEGIQVLVQSRLWAHSVGIVNTIRQKGILFSGEHGETEDPGTGITMKWGDHFLILTAKHLLDGAKPSDLRIYFDPGHHSVARSLSEVTAVDCSEPLPLPKGEWHIYRCEWDDLAFLTSASLASSKAEFFDATNWADPVEGQLVHSFGYPTANNVILARQRVGMVEHRTAGIVPTVWSGNVVTRLERDQQKYLKSYDLERHYLVPFQPAKSGLMPFGISGAGMWLELEDSVSKGSVWVPKFRFAGVCTCCYKNGTIEQVVRASSAIKFISEQLGSL